ncbi:MULTISPECIES: hypothetical protein [Micromonospora]|uniref:Uncharacterized protein n=1 Tax=Micromonospora sicca TaxID=2202420 RepID=A0A317DUK1_9ACTN|nr:MULTISPECIES: hypothetical protein [unclassified Micromonospora]MBM0227619.1 hypothetical protein [Micromonospora sp. ATA51]PWR16623.1 hypothetical protein DKT69_04580 [Micromonospora sp. 4G51]
MDARTDDRWRGGLLAGLALAAVVAGAWWWRQAAPAIGPVSAAVSSAAPSPAPAGLLRVVVDAEDGHLVEGPVADPDQPLVFHRESGAAGAPERSETIWADRSHLSQGGPPLVRQTGAEMGGRYLLVAGCVGSGPVTIQVAGADGAPEERADCGGPPVLLRLTAVGGTLEVRFTADDGPADLDAHLSVLS